MPFFLPDIALVMLLLLRMRPCSAACAESTSNVLLLSPVAAFLSRIAAVCEALSTIMSCSVLSAKAKMSA